MQICQATTCVCTNTVAVALGECVNCYWQQSPTQTTLDTTNALINRKSAPRLPVQRPPMFTDARPADYYNEICAAFPDLPRASVTTTVVGSTTGTVSTTSLPTINQSTVTSIPNTTTPPPQTVVRPPTTTSNSDGSASTATTSGSGSSGENGALPTARRGQWGLVAAASVVVGVLVV